MSNNKGMKSSHKTAVIIVIVIAVLVILMTPNPVSNWVSSTTGGTGGTGGGFGQTPTAIAAFAPTEKLVVSNNDTGANVTALSGVFYRGGALDGNQILSTDNTFAVNANEEYFWIVENSNPNTVGFYPFKTPVQTAKSGDSDKLNAYKALAAGTVTTTITNDNGSTTNDTADRTTAQALAAGESAQFKVRVAGATQYAYFGGPDLEGNQAFAVCADFNTNAIAKVSMTSADRTVTAIDTPYGVRAVDTTNSLGKNCWKVSGTVSYADRIDLYLTATASSTVNPSIDANVNIRVMDQYIKQRSDNGVFGAFFYDPVTDNTAIGATDRTDSIGIS